MSHPTLGTLQAQLQSARKSILFMETQHAATLKGLHAEIQSLQKKCSELSFDAAMRGEENEKGEVSELFVEQLKKDVGDLTQEKVTLLQLLEQKDKQFVELENHAILQEKKYLNELKIKNHRISTLNNEIESRANTIGYLTAQLHQARSKLYSQSKLSPSVTPVPPNQPKSSTRLRRNSKSVEANFRPSSSGGNTSNSLKAHDSTLSIRPLSASSASGLNVDKLRRPLRKSGARFSPSPMPDPTPFLNAAENSGTVHKVRPPSVLPPIHKRVATVQDSNGNPAYNVTSLFAFQSRDDKIDSFSDPAEIAVRECKSALAPKQDVKRRSTTAPVGDGAVI